MSSILNKLGLGHDSNSAASSSSSSSTTSGSTHSSMSGSHSTTSTTTTGTTGSNMAGANYSGTNTVNRTGYADTGAYAHTAGTGTGYMTRSEERLLVGKEQVSAGVASLNKYVTTEHVSTAVPITKEHVVIEREPIAPGDAIRSDIKEAHYEVALTEERAVAAKEAVAVEKVKLRKEVEHAVQNVDADLRKEHIEFGTTVEQGKTLGAAPGTAGYDKTYNNTTTRTGSNIDPVANPRV